VGPRASLDGFGKYRPHRDLIPGPIFQGGEDLHCDLLGSDAV